MFKSVKSKIALAAELIMPWLVLIGGIPAFYYWDKTGEEWAKEYYSEAYYHASEMLELFFNVSMIIGVIAIIAEATISLAAFIMMIIAFTKKDNNKGFTMLILSICGVTCVFGALALMFVVIIFTYAQGV